MIKMLQIIACKTITVLIKAIVSASLLSPIFSPRAFAHILQNFFIALAAGVEPATYGLEVRCSIQLNYASVLELRVVQTQTQIRDVAFLPVSTNPEVHRTKAQGRISYSLPAIDL